MAHAQAPVLVIHGAAVRDRAAFESEVARMSAATGSARPFVPVFWGDLARPAELVEQVLPYGEWLAGASGDAKTVDDSADGPETVSGELEADLEQALAVGDDAGAESAIARLRRMWSERDLDALVERFGENWRRQSTVARRRMLGALYRAVRAQYLATSANFAGDIILYQRRQAEIHARVWETLIRQAPGWGLAETPVTVVTHSLGGSVAFDIAVAGNPPLHIDHLVSCGCTAPYFHVIGCSPSTLPPHEPGEPVLLPPTIGAWTNFFVPLDPWGYIAAPVFRLHDGTAPDDVELHTGEREDRILRHGAAHYWHHPRVIGHLREVLGATSA